MMMSKMPKTIMNDRIDDISDIVEERLRILVEDGAKAEMDVGSVDVQFPDYFDARKFRLAQRAFRDNMFTMMIAKLCGLLALLAVPSILDVLVFTKQSGTTCAAFRRYVSTILHTFVWYESPAKHTTEFFVSLKNVRKKHCVAFGRSANAGVCRVNQLDMALAQFGFIGYTMLCREELGIHLSEDELEGLVHFWRVIGFMLGMDDRYNLCAGNAKETRQLCKRLMDKIFLPSLARENKTFEDMGRTLIEGVWPINPFLDTQAFTAFTLHLSIAAATNNNHSLKIDTTKMSTYGKFILKLQLFVHEYLMRTTFWWSAIFRAFFNGQMRLSIFLTEKFPFLAYYMYGVRDSHVNIYSYYN